MRIHHDWRAFKRALLGAALCVMTAADARPAHAQTPSACMCSQNFAMVTLALVDSKGAPVQDATVRVRRVRSGTTRVATADMPGAYTIADDMLRDSLRADGERFEISVRWHGRTQRVTAVVGTREPRKAAKNGAVTNNCRCHVLRISGPEKLVLR